MMLLMLLNVDDNSTEIVLLGLTAMVVRLPRNGKLLTNVFKPLWKNVRKNQKPPRQLGG